MPTTTEHLARAKQNLEFARTFDLATTPYIDWPVVAYFYAALHLVDALLWEKDKINPAEHKDRNDFIRDKYYLCGIRNEYRTLKDKSEDARYDLITFTKPKIEREVIPLYEAIEQHVTQQLKDG